MVAPGPVPSRARPLPAARQRPVQRRRRHRRTRLVARSLLVLVLALTVGTGTFVAGLLAAPIDLSLLPPPTAVLLLAADGRQFATLQPTERHENVSATDIPQVMRDAIIAAEDERFLRHNGVDVLATIRAAFRDLTGGGVEQGGSTLTQQYVKNAYVGPDRTALRKVREAALAVRLEQKLTKQQILTDYLNALYLGNGLYGVQAGAKYYFGVPVKDLDLNTSTGRRDPLLALARASMLAGIAPAPSLWNPVKDFATARIRQQYTLNRMVVGGYATPQQVSDAYHYDVRPLRVRTPETPTIAPEFADYVRKRIRSSPAYDEDTFFRGSLRVRTTLDLDLQQAFDDALQEVLPDASDPQAAIVAVDYTTGDIRAMATLRRVPRVFLPDGKVFTSGVAGYQRLGYNLAAAAHRSTGSTIKPFTLAVALEEGMSLDTTRYARNKDSIPNPGGAPNPYVYSNSDISESGWFSLRRALADSINTVFVPLAKQVGRKRVFQLAQAAGLDAPVDPKGPPWVNLAFGIGAGVEVSPISEASAYGTFADGGLHVPLRAYTEIRTGATAADPGRVLETRPVGRATRVMPAGVASDVVSAMTDVVQYGTGVHAQQPFPVFGKTGTTDDATDAWFTGCIPSQKICIATWMGYEYSSCQVFGPKHIPLRVAGPCGGMKKLHGVRGLVFGGTLPARIFATAQADLRTIKAQRAARAVGLPIQTATPSPTYSPRPHPRHRAHVARTKSPTPSPSAAPSRTPTPSPTRTSILPTPPGSPPPTSAPP